jgi:molybdate transport system substrate-binding protein
LSVGGRTGVRELLSSAGAADRYSESEWRDAPVGIPTVADRIAQRTSIASGVFPTPSAREKGYNRADRNEARSALGLLRRCTVKDNTLLGRLKTGLITAVLVVLAVAAFPGASFAQVRVILSGGITAAYKGVLPEFEKTSGIKVMTTNGASRGSGPNTIAAELRRGEPADVVIMNRAGLNDLIAEGKIAAGTDVDLARTLIAVTVRTGAPKPDISTLDAFKQTLSSARSVAVDASTSGIYLTTKAFPRLGIAKEMGGKTMKEGAPAVADGKAEIAVMLVSEILPVKGAEVVGTVSAEIQDASVFSAALVAGGKEVESATAYTPPARVGSVI